MHLLPFFGQMLLDDISERDFERFKASRKEMGLSNKSINNFLGVLNVCLRHAHEWGESSRRVKASPLKAAMPRIEYLDFAQAGQLLRVIADPEWYGMVLLALRTGMRIGEIRALDWSDIDVQRGAIAVRRAYSDKEISTPKSNRERHIPISNDLRQWIEWRGARKGFVFQDSNGKPYLHGPPKRALIKFCDAASVPRIGWHGLRHTFASHLVMRGVPMLAVQQLMGHSDIRVTMRYSHLAPSTLSDAIGALQGGSRVENLPFGQPVVNASAGHSIVEANGLNLIRSTKRKTPALR